MELRWRVVAQSQLPSRPKERFQLRAYRNRSLLRGRCQSRLVSSRLAVSSLLFGVTTFRTLRIFFFSLRQPATRLWLWRPRYGTVRYGTVRYGM